MIESQGHFKGQTVHRSTLAGQTLQDSLNYRGQQQLSQDLTVTGKELHYRQPLMFSQMCICSGVGRYAWSQVPSGGGRYPRG